MEVVDLCEAKRQCPILGRHSSSLHVVDADQLASWMAPLMAPMHIDPS